MRLINAAERAGSRVRMQRPARALLYPSTHRFGFAAQLVSARLPRHRNLARFRRKLRTSRELGTLTEASNARRSRECARAETKQKPRTLGSVAPRSRPAGLRTRGGRLARISGVGFTDRFADCASPAGFRSSAASAAARLLFERGRVAANRFVAELPAWTRLRNAPRRHAELWGSSAPEGARPWR